ncbi:MAG: threonine--tRNA ligase [Acidimicrobiales bacterium]|nr:threonine--tRNA ligase [Acidimicrobiales bacterium]
MEEVKPSPIGTISGPEGDGQQSLEEWRGVLRHSTAHIMAQAVMRLWPGTQLAIGPSIADGFYYDFKLPNDQRFKEEDLVQIEKEMKKIIKENQSFVRQEINIEQAKEVFGDQPFKLEIIDAVEQAGATGEFLEEVEKGNSVSLYKNGDGFVDLCRGPHVPSTGHIPAFKLLRVAGSYWRGSEANPSLQRVYGTAWESKALLDEHLYRLEEAEKRDHRRLGVEMDLFHFPPEIGSGLAVFHPKGAKIRMLLEDFSRREHLENGYEPVWTPHTAKSDLFAISGHLGWYKEGMYPGMELDGSTYYLKPMNCPMHVLIYKDRLRSYRELPLRLYELGTVYRYERSGVLHGLARVRALTQDDSHIFCAPDQLPQELASILKFILKTLATFGLKDFQAELSTRPEKYVGDPKDWELATEALRDALISAGIDYVVSEGDGAFYAPKIDVHLKDAIGRKWQVSTMQVDLQMPKLFDLEFIGKDNERHQPYMVHRVLFGSVERFYAILLEHFAGAMPTWLCPTHARVLPVRNDHEDYAMEIVAKAKAEGLSFDMEEANEPLGARVRKAKLEKLPYILVVGDQDVEAKTVGVNLRGTNDPERGVGSGEIIARIKSEIDRYALAGE